MSAEVEANAPAHLGRRLAENPLIVPADVVPSLPQLEVVSVFNAAAARVGDEILLLLRVAERPRDDAEPPPDALMLDLTGRTPSLRPLPPGYRAYQLVSLCFLDTAVEPPRVVVAYVPRDLPGLDLGDPRTIRYQAPGNAGGALGAIGDVAPIDFLAQMSHLRLARSKDGVHFTVDAQPTLTPMSVFEEYGIEDPRATYIEGAWQITYVSAARVGITTSRAVTRDFREYARMGLMFLPDHKDVVLFPERVGGRYAALTRPMPQSFGRILGMWIAFSDDLDSWGGHQPIALPRPHMWDEQRTGAGSVPFLTSEGWLELYHGVDRHSRYAMGALLLDADDPRLVLGRSAEPLMAPHAPYERGGLFPETIFSCGHVTLGDDAIRMYYGAADSVVAAADFSIKEILASLEPC